MKRLTRMSSKTSTKSVWIGQRVQAAVCSFSISFLGAELVKCWSMVSVLRKAWSPTTYLLLLILQVLQYCCYADASIDISPEPQHVNLSQVATFHCRATGVNTFWNINNQTYRTNNGTENGYTFTEILVSSGENRFVVHDLYLQVPATVENNGTQVQCLTFDSAHISSRVVSLLVQGGPAAPQLTLSMISPFLLRLTWEEPFTWPHTVIKHYSLSVNNSLENWNQRLTTTSTVIRSSDKLAVCTAYTFSVSANNGLAEGQRGNVTGGFPIIDPILPSDPIESSIHYDADFNPIVQLHVKLPEVCSYQAMRYTVAATDQNSRPVLHEENTVLYNDGARLTFTVTGSQQGDDSMTSLQVTATFDLVGVEGTSSQPMPLTAHMTIDVSAQGSGLDTKTVVLISAVSGAVLLIAVVFLVVVTSVCAYKKKRSGRYRTGSPKNSPMVTNPIYEGQSVYETIDPQFRAVSFSSSGSIPGPPTPTSVRPLIESPYAHSQVDPAYASPHPNLASFPPVVMEEGYTVMTSAGALGKATSDFGESNLDQSTPDNSRYVPEPCMVATEC